MQRDGGRRQDESYQESILPWSLWQDSMVVASSARKCMSDWIPNKIGEEYALTPDWDNRWRTGGSLQEIIAESHLDADSIRTGIRRFVDDRDQRLEKLRSVPS